MDQWTSEWWIVDLDIVVMMMMMMMMMGDG